VIDRQIETPLFQWRVERPLLAFGASASAPKGDALEVWRSPVRFERGIVAILFVDERDGGVFGRARFFHDDLRNPFAALRFCSVERPLTSVISTCGIRKSVKYQK